MIEGWRRSEAPRAPLEVTSEGCCLQLMAVIVLFTPHPLFKSPLLKHTFGVNNSLDWRGISRLQGRRKAPPIQQQLQEWCEACCKESWCEVWPSLQFGQTLTCNGKFRAEALARTPTPAWLPGTLVDVPEIVLLLFQPFHRPKVRWRGSSSGSIPKFFVYLAMQTQVTAVTKLCTSLSGHCTQAVASQYVLVMQEFTCNVQPGESCFVLLIIIHFYLLIIF